jgi:hypothetical protein
MQIPSTTGRLGGAAAAGASLALALAACGGSSGGPASGGGGTSSPAADSTQAARYAQCMRAHGVPDFPDPVDGHLSLTVRKGTDLDPADPAFKSAQRACRKLAPAGLGSGGAQSTGQQSQLLKFVRCMRSHGVKDFPDPSSGGAVVMQGIDPQSPQFQSAMQSCRKLLPAGALGG